ncbi:TPA: Com family DNA-binding transcriptional regulator [Pseudomonas aeruginosa]|nr:Com family DNA-binding transcriptional regulator [Pseudomonas aeruginosa]HBO1674511.1 Com family DNA-binding transcriptional regulator [Pseudomonas aeruginosa]HBO2046285.1 Com family DNA-binding transcriptional regulator [Pseudomonas aeruginosa]HBO2057231.1 Com family DNA-binding transcriptional regulator [Pseudomonas aeruginosa]HBO2226885.1 Com family DNA-binding transcriptional regulator [Pseudomonas aeruginosa]
MQMLQEIRCGQCRRKLAAASGFTELQIKCPRCGTLNHLKATSLPSAPTSAARGGNCENSQNTRSQRLQVQAQVRADHSVP